MLKVLCTFSCALIFPLPGCLLHKHAVTHMQEDTLTSIPQSVYIMYTRTHTKRLRTRSHDMHTLLGQAFRGLIIQLQNVDQTCHSPSPPLSLSLSVSPSLVEVALQLFLSLDPVLHSHPFLSPHPFPAFQTRS